MFSFLFLLGIRVEVTSANALDVVAKSKTVPTFLLLYSPYCGFCHQVLPTWDELIDKYENDTEIVIGKIDCIANNVCRKIAKNLVGYPTFNTYLRGKPRSIRPDRTIESFSNIVENLKQVKLNVPCQEYPFEMGSDYPSFVIGVDKGEKKCDKVNKILKEFPKLEGQVYYNESSKKSLVALMTQNTNITYNGDFSQESINEFIREFSLVSLTKWDLNSASRTKRRFMFIVFTLYKDIIYHKYIAEQHENTLLIGYIELKTFNQTYPKLAKDLNVPTVFVASKTKKTFHIVSHYDEGEDLLKIVEDVENGTYDEEGNIQVPKLFKVSEEKSNDNGGSIVFDLLVGTLVSLIVIIVVFMIKKAPAKIE